MCAKFPVYCSALRVIWVWKINAQPLIIKIKRFLSSLVSVGVVIALVVGSFFYTCFCFVATSYICWFYPQYLSSSTEWFNDCAGQWDGSNFSCYAQKFSPKVSGIKKKEPSLLSKRYALLTVTFSKAKGLQSFQYAIYNTVIIIIMIIISLLCAFVWFFFPSSCSLHLLIFASYFFNLIGTD